MLRIAGATASWLRWSQERLASNSLRSALRGLLKPLVYPPVGISEGEGHAVLEERLVNAFCAQRDVPFVPLISDHSVVVSAHRVVEVAFEVENPPKFGRGAIGKDRGGEPGKRAELVRKGSRSGVVLVAAGHRWEV